MNEKATSEWMKLVAQEVKRLPESDYIVRLIRLAIELSSTTRAKISVFPKRVVSARAAVYDVETGEVAPRMRWSLKGMWRPVLVGEDDEGRPFLLHTLREDWDNVVALRKSGA